MHPVPVVFANRYVVLSRLGNGAQGEVYAVFDQHEQDDVALKLLKPEPHPMGPWAEAAILRNLTDHHILPIRNADVHLGQPYLVTALARNGSIDALVTNSAGAGLAVDQTVAWVRQACHGLARGHDAYLVHNDVKPANLFLNDRGECVVADWGFAGQIDRTTGHARPPGATAETAAPEIAAAWNTPTTSASIASDIYALGASAYWMLAGGPPLDLTGCPDVATKMAAVAAGRVPRLAEVAPHVPRWLYDRIDKAMAPTPGDRYGSAHEFAAALGQRPAVTRRWTHTNEHAGHVGCWRGESTGTGSTLVMCMSGGTGRRVEIVTTHLASGRRVNAGCGQATLGTWPQAVRRLIRALG